MSFILKDLTPVLQSTYNRGVGAQRWQHPSWVAHLPPCNERCPAGENIQGWLAHLHAGDHEAAWRTLVEDNPLPSTHGRACYHPCENACSRRELDEPVAIHAVERFLGDLALERGWTINPGQPTGKKVLVVGAGPAGLSCAWHLRRLGHAVEIWDAMAEAGGMLHYGIPAYRLPREGLQREIRRIEAIGTTFRMNTRIADLHEVLGRGQFDACFLATGTHAGNHLDIPAMDGRQMVDAISLFQQVEAGNPPLLGRVVGIVGGGNTAMDAARVAKRLGAQEAVLIYRRDAQHVRADKHEVSEAFLEGVQAQWLRQPVSFGRAGVTVEQIALGADGSLRPTGAFETLPVDALVLALGQHADLSFLGSSPDVLVSQDGNIVVNSLHQTARDGVFAGGDVIGGPRTMTAATGHGKKAARAIHGFLRATTHQGTKSPRVAFSDLNLSSFHDAARSHVRALPVEERRGFDEVVATLDAGQARYEAGRCLSCGNCFECDNCLAACPEHAIGKVPKAPKYQVNLELCTGCSVCFDQCPCGAIEMVEEERAASAELRPASFKEHA